MSALCVGLAIVASMLVLSSCGGEADSSASKSNETTTEGRISDAKSMSGTASASPLAGPTPLKVDFKYQAKRSDGEVTVEWDFGDGTKSNEISPTHTYKKAEWHAVRMVAKDSGGNEDVWNLVLRAFTPAKWEAYNDPKVKRSAKQIQEIVGQSQYEYYKKYPEALPYKPDSTFYKQFPQLKPLLKYRAKAIKEKGIQITAPVDGGPTEEGSQGK